MTDTPDVLVAVSTCQRQVNYLGNTLRSLDTTGARDMPKVLMWNGTDADVKISFESFWSIKKNPEPKSTRTNLWAAIRLAAEMKVDRLLYFEDDIVACRNAVTHMAQVPIPEQVGVMSFFDQRLVSKTVPNGVYTIPIKKISKGLWGMVAVVFPRGALGHLAKQDPFSVLKDEPERNGDRVVGLFLQDSKWPRIGINAPSLCEHVGAVSAARPGAVLKGRQALNWPGEGFDALSLGSLESKYKKVAVAMREEP